MAEVKYNRNWQKVVTGAWTNEGILEASTDIHRRAVILAPVETSALVNSGRISKVVGGYKITFGGGKVPYAKRRHFENNRNPQTKRYLSRAGDSVLRGNMSKYFKGKV